ncbi:MAG TPA: 7TM-DISM domain-containing protein, partial [Mucilaginibacter sp.]
MFILFTYFKKKTVGLSTLLPSTLVLLTCFLAISANAQQKVEIDDQVNQHIFSYKEIECLEDPKGTLKFDQITSPEIASQFKESWSSTPQNYNQSSVYWYKITIAHPLKTQKNWMLEFFDQTIDDITAYLPTGNGQYKVERLGALYQFGKREIHHKNFGIDLNLYHPGNYTYYFRIKSHQTADVIIVLRSVNWFIEYALSEYLLFGVFYGMIL